MMKRFINFIIFCLMLSSCASAQQAEDPFQVFWNKFRTAVIHTEKNTIRSLTKFPFEVKGSTDSTPIAYYTRAEFVTIIDSLLDQPFYLFSGEDVVTNSMRKVITNKRNIRKSDLQSKDLVRIEQFTFIRSQGKWLFDRAYVEDVTLMNESQTSH